MAQQVGTAGCRPERGGFFLRLEQARPVVPVSSAPKENGTVVIGGRQGNANSIGRIGRCLVGTS